MLTRFLAFAVALTLMANAAQARRVALVIGQNAYQGGASATVGLQSLDNPVRDARRMAQLLAQHGFEVVACDAKIEGCLDLDRSQLLNALSRLQERAAGADLALVFFAGHGMATEEGNILTPVDAKVNCATGAVTDGVLVERIMAATEPARMKLVILDACRDNPLGAVCPNLKGKKLSFTRIEAGAMRDFLLVTSTQFGQQALDGPKGTHSPFATALFSSLEANPSIYFEQVFNEVARATYEATQKPSGLFQPPFLQIPGKVVGGAAPADCLAGKACIGDARMAALAIENEQLGKDAAGLRNILEAEEKVRGKPYSAEERSKRVSELENTLASIATSTDPMRQEAKRLIDGGNVAGGQAKLDQALDADEKALAEIDRAGAERRKAAAQSARDLAVLARGTDVVKAVEYYERATRIDPSDPQIWDGYARAALDAGRTAEAKRAFEQTVHTAHNPRQRYWAILGLGDVAARQGNLPNARQHYEQAMAIAEPVAKANPGNASWQRALSVSQGKIGDVLVAQGNVPAALDAFKAAHAIADRLAKAEPGNLDRQRDLSVVQQRIGDVMVQQGNLSAALDAFKALHGIADRLAKADPGNLGRQRDLAVSHIRVGDMLLEQGNLTAAFDDFKASLAIRDRLAKADPGNADWQRNLSLSQQKIGEVLRAQGNLPAALDAFKASYAIFDHLAKADPADVGWRQRDLAVSQSMIGDVLLAQGNLSAALDTFKATHAIFDRFVKADAGNAGWQHDLSVSLEKIGDVLRQQGNLPAALDAFQASLAIRDRLAKADPSNVGRHQDVARAHGRIAMVLARQSERERALAAFRQGRDIIIMLKATAPTNATLPKDLNWFDAEIRTLEKQ